MKTIVLGIGVVAGLVLTPAFGQNLVVNGDFEGGFAAEPYLGLGYKIANGWQWCAFPINSGPSSNARAYPGTDIGMDGSDCQRLRVLQNTTAQSFMWQCIDTVPGRTYTVRGYWKIAGAGGAGGCSVCQPLFPWIGVFFLNGGTPGDSSAAYFANHDLVRTFLPTIGYNNPFRVQWPYNPPYVPTTLIIPPNKEIVAEHAYHYFYEQPQLAEATQLDYWESYYDAAGGAGDPTMPGIGEPAANGGGAAWQTKVATGDHMLVGFFVLDAPATTGDGTDLYIDNVEVTAAPLATPSDFDDDGDVDLADFATFLACFNGAAQPPAPGCTGDADFDDDNDVDLADFATFLTCFNGATRPPACP